MSKIHTILLSLIFASGCAEDQPEADTTARGVCTYEDGAAPQPQPVGIEVEVEGTGSLDGLEPQCELDGLSGSFEGLFEGEADIGENGAFVAGMASAAATFVTPGGCEIPQLDIEAVTRVTVRATLPATETNCQAYCAARTDAASCAATCQVNTEARIAAEVELSADQVAAVSARNLSGGALGDLEVSLTFDHRVDAEGNLIAE